MTFLKRKLKNFPSFSIALHVSEIKLLLCIRAVGYNLKPLALLKLWTDSNFYKLRSKLGLISKTGYTHIY